MRATKITTGIYEYRGYRVEKQDSEYGTDWIISEATEGGWSPVDAFETLREAKYFIDLWKATE